MNPENKGSLAKYQEGRLAGIKEAVGWLYRKSTAQETDFPPKLIAFTMLYEEWRSKLKEWGIE